MRGHAPRYVIQSSRPEVGAAGLRPPPFGRLPPGEAPSGASPPYPWSPAFPQVASVRLWRPSAPGGTLRGRPMCRVPPGYAPQTILSSHQPPFHAPPPRPWRGSGLAKPSLGVARNLWGLQAAPAGLGPPVLGVEMTGRALVFLELYRPCRVVGIDGVRLAQCQISVVRRRSRRVAPLGCPRLNVQSSSTIDTNEGR